MATGSGGSEPTTDAGRDGDGPAASPLGRRAVVLVGLAAIVLVGLIAVVVTGLMAVVIVGHAGAATGVTGSGLAGGLETPGAATSDDVSTDSANGTLEVSDLEGLALAIRNGYSGPSGVQRQPGTVSVTVRNPGEQPRTSSVGLYLVAETNESVDQPMDQKRVTLDPGAERTVDLQAFDVLVKGPGEYTIRAQTDDSATDATVRIYHPGFTYFTLETVGTETVRPGETGTLTVRVRNAGRPPETGPDSQQSPGLAIVTARVNGVVVDARNVWLDVDESTTIELSVPSSALATGDNRVLVTSSAEHDRRLDTLIRPTMTLQSTASGGAGPGVGFVGAVLAVVLAVVGRAAVRR